MTAGDPPVFRAQAAGDAGIDDGGAGDAGMDEVGANEGIDDAGMNDAGDGVSIAP